MTAVHHPIASAFHFGVSSTGSDDRVPWTIDVERAQNKFESNGEVQAGAVDENVDLAACSFKYISDRLVNWSRVQCTDVSWWGGRLVLLGALRRWP